MFKNKWVIVHRRMNVNSDLTNFFLTQVKPIESRHGTEQMRTFDPTNESAICWSAAHCYDFIIGVK